jgi:hypothetical protein
MNRTDYILMLEAIRAGIPSRITVDATSDLRHHLEAKIEKDLALLESGHSPKGRLVWGEYGQGKTHLLKLMEKHILDNGFAVSYVSLSRQLNLSNLSNLFPALASHLLIRDAKIPGLLNPLTMESMPSEFLQNLPLIEQKICHPLPAYVFRAFARYDSQNLVLLYNALMGKKENVTSAKKICREHFKAEMKQMPRFLQKDHLKSFFEFLPHLLQALGYKGWVILIDELEITGKLGKVARLKSYQNLAWLLNWSKQHKLPIYTLAASVKALQEEVFFGKKKNDAEAMPQLAEERFDATEAAAIRSFFDLATDSHNLVLAPVGKKELLTLLNQLLEIHHQAIDWQHPIPETFVQDALKLIEPTGKPVRQIVRIFIEIMDLFAYTGSMPASFTQNLIVDADFEEEESTDNDGSGLIETSLQDIFEL